MPRPILRRARRPQRIRVLSEEESAAMLLDRQASTEAIRRQHELEAEFGRVEANFNAIKDRQPLLGREVEAATLRARLAEVIRNREGYPHEAEEAVEQLRGMLEIPGF